MSSVREEIEKSVINAVAQTLVELNPVRVSNNFHAICREVEKKLKVEFTNDFTHGDYQTNAAFVIAAMVKEFNL